jgi:hypothetical protein
MSSPTRHVKRRPRLTGPRSPVLVAALLSAVLSGGAGCGGNQPTKPDGPTPSPEATTALEGLWASSSPSFSFLHVVDRRRLLFRTFRLDLASGALSEVSSIGLPGTPRDWGSYGPEPAALTADPLGRFVYLAGGSWQLLEPRVGGYLRTYGVDSSTGVPELRSGVSLEGFPAFQKVRSARTIPTTLTAAAQRVFVTFQYQEGWQGSGHYHDHSFDYWAAFDVAADGTLSSTLDDALGGQGPDDSSGTGTYYFPVPDPETGWVVEVNSPRFRTLAFDSGGVRTLFQATIALPGYGSAGATMVAGHVVVLGDTARLSLIALDRASGSLRLVGPGDPLIDTSYLSQEQSGLAAGPTHLLAVSVGSSPSMLRLYTVGDDGTLTLRDQRDTTGAHLLFHPFGTLLLRTVDDGIEVYAIGADRHLTLLRTEPIRGDAMALTPGRP